jgi:hypothetical protein
MRVFHGDAYSVEDEAEMSILEIERDVRAIGKT